MKTYTYRTIIEPDGKGFHGFVPQLKGVHTVGKTMEETQKNLQEAIRCHLDGLAKDKKLPAVPKPPIEIGQTFTINA